MNNITSSRNNSEIVPIFQSPAATLYHGDAVDTLNSLDASSVDLVFADPPYKLSNGGITCHSGKRVCVDKAEWDVSVGIKEDFNFHMSWINACRRILKPNGTIWISGTYHNIFSCGYALQVQGWHLINDIIWYKRNASPNLSCRMFTASHETLIWAKLNKHSKHYFDYEAMKYGDWHKDMLKVKDKQMRSVWSINGALKDEKIFGRHPTQKPLMLMKRIILASCPLSGVVLDPFCGSGSSGVASLALKRRFIGIDSNLDYLADLAVPRLSSLIRGTIHGT